MKNNQNLNEQVNTDNVENQQRQNNNGNNKILIILMALIIVVLAGYIVYAKIIQKDDNTESKSNNIQENNNSQNENNNTQTDNNQQTTNTDLDISQISAESFKVRDFMPEKLEVIQKEKKFELAGENQATLSVSVDETKSTIKYKSNTKSITKEFNNVSKVFYSDYGNCSPHTLVYVISNSKIYLVNINNYSDSYEENLTDSNFVKEISNSNNYVDIYMDYLHPSTCDFIPLWLGRTADGKYYDLETSTEYKENTYFYYADGNNYVKNDKTYIFGNNSGKIKLGFIDEVDEELRAFIDENNHLYEFNYDTYSEYKLVSNEKVKKVQKQGEKYSFIFANGNQKELDIDYLNAYK